MSNVIKIVGAYEHNLKKISLSIPRDKYVVITGVSGSGKSTLAFNTIYAEGQRRYIESLSSYARQFLDNLDKPHVESIEGLSPAIAIEQKTIGKNPRSTVGTITEIYDYYRLLYARIGVPYDPYTGKMLKKFTIDEICDVVMNHPENTKLTILAPVVINKKGTHKKLLDDAMKLGFTRVRLNGEFHAIEDMPALKKNNKYTIDIVTGRIVVTVKNKKRIVEALERALDIAAGKAIGVFDDGTNHTEEHYALQYNYSNSELNVPEFEPQSFSFNSPIGSCPRCLGLGYTMEFAPNLLIPDKTLSFSERAIIPFTNWYYYDSIIDALAKKHGLTIDTPFDEWGKTAFHELLYGTDSHLQYTYASFSSNYTVERNKRFNGIIPELERRYRSTHDLIFQSFLEQFMDQDVCSECKGGRLRVESLHVKIKNVPIHKLTSLSVKESIAFFNALVLNERDKTIAVEILREINSRLHFLSEVGLGYLTLDRYAGSLSGGESQRIRLASQIGSALVGVLYVLDEPTIGLHQRDNERLLNMLLHLRDLGNTVLVVEHDEQAIRMADYVVDIGPSAGKFGGEVVASGTPAQLQKMKNSLTAKYLAGELYAPIPEKRRDGNGREIVLGGVKEHNLKNIQVHIPLGKFTVVTGVSGSGKSTLIQDVLYPAVHNNLLRTKMRTGAYDFINGIDSIDKIIDINQSPIGRTSRSNPGTYIKVFDHIRDLFSQLPEAKARGYSKGRFSFNVRGGRCEACQGAGTQLIEMHFLSDVYVTCEKCNGFRFNRETLEIKYKEKNIYDVLAMTVDEALLFFEKIPVIARKLLVLQRVGMGYISIGQSAVTLSGGEAQRVKLALELSKVSTGNTLYLLDEPTTGLHQKDILNLLSVLHELVDRGNTLVIIEHNLEFISQADHIIDLGPEGGDEGGNVVTFGSPEMVMKDKKSYTGKFLKEYLDFRNAKQ